MNEVENDSLDELFHRQIKFALDDVMGFIGFKEIGVLFDFKGPEVEFFKSQILVEGLQDFHINTEANITVEEKRQAVRDVIEAWNKKGLEIKEL